VATLRAVVVEWLAVGEGLLKAVRAQPSMPE
jgi:hypothetical protein